MANLPKDTAKSPKLTKSSKTAHVLNLLTESEKRPDPPPLPKETRESSPPTRTSEDALAQQIRQALEQEMSVAEAPATPPTVSDSGSAHPSVSPQTLAVVSPSQADSPPPAASASHEMPRVETVCDPETEPALMPPSVMQPKTLPDISYTNVMQALVEEKVDKYIRLFHLCPCPRCKIDVMALSLTKLPAKYVVTHKNEAIPMLSVYERRYNTAVISQVMWACKTVMDHPRH